MNELLCVANYTKWYIGNEKHGKEKETTLACA